jgi:cysteine-rich repeat protein
MRTPILATFLGLSLVACAGQIEGTGGGPNENCGNGTIEAEEGETCDDNNNVDGDGCSATCITEVEPSFSATLDRDQVATELGKSEIVKLVFTSVGGFTGPVSVATSFVDAANAAVPLVVVGGPTSVTLTANETTSVDYTVAIPSNTTGTALTATLKVDIISPLIPINLTSSVSITPNYTLVYAANTGEDTTKHPIQAGQQPATLTLKRGATISYKNEDTVPHVTHGGGVPHEPTNPAPPATPVNGLPGNTYIVQTTPVAPGNTITFGCHDHPDQNDASYSRITIE